MNDKLFRDLINLLLSHAEDQRDVARQERNDLTGDTWSAIVGHLQNARQRMRR